MASPPPPRVTSPLQPYNPYLPPEKRQKLSHGPSPLGTSPVGNAYPPYSPQWSPHSQHPTVQYTYPPNPLESFNQPQPVQAPVYEHAQPQRQMVGVMGPPERPQKPIDPNDITDMVALSGVDLRAEDEYLAQSYNRPSSFSTSFETQPSQTLTPGNSFNQWSQGNYGSQPAFSAHAPFNQPPVTPETLEAQLREKHKRAARAYEQNKATHLKDPFLAAQPVRQLLHKKAYEEHVRFESRGVTSQPMPAQSANLRPEDVQAQLARPTDATDNLVKATVRFKIDADSPTVEVLTLLSLACSERLRTTLEESFASARARRYGSQGIVPPEWSEIAQGNGTAESTMAASQSITGTAWDRPAGSVTSPQPPKTVDPSSGRLPTPPTEPSPPPQPTVSYKSSLPSLLQVIAEQDREAEKLRLERRRKRQKDRQSSIISDIASPSTPVAGAGPTTPAADPAILAPKLTKKALAAEKKSAVNEEVARKQANATANMALGAGGKKYSWLTGGIKAGGGGGLTAGAGMGRGVGTPRTGSTPGTPGGVPAAGKPVVQEDPGLKSKELYKGFGNWREDGEKGQGVQIRDLIGVLERDGLEKRTLARCYARLRSDEKER